MGRGDAIDALQEAFAEDCATMNAVAPLNSQRDPTKWPRIKTLCWNAFRGLIGFGIGFFDIATDSLFLASIWQHGKVSSGVKAGLLLFIVVSPVIYFGIGAYHYVQSKYDPKEFRRRLPVYFCTYYVNARHDALLPFHLLALLLDTALITVRIPFFFLAFLPEHYYNDNYQDFTRRFVGLEAAFEALPQVILQTIATAQMDEITAIFIVSVVFSAISALVMIIHASCEACGDRKKLASNKHRPSGP